MVIVRSFRALTLTACMVLVIPAIALAEPSDGSRLQLLRVHVRDAQQLETLVELDQSSREMEIWSEAVGIGPIDVRVNADDRRELDKAGFAYDVVIEDLGADFAAKFAKSASDDFFASYPFYDDYVTFMTDLATNYPDLAEMVDVGTSVQGRHLWALRITGPGSNKPGVLFHGAQHGNEAIGPPVIAYAAQQLLTQYGTDDRITFAVDNAEWFLLPIMNPDGYTTRSRNNAHGKDLNRNWGGPGSYTNPFSEPETSAIRDFLLAHPNVHAYLDLHSFGYEIMWPWGHTIALCSDDSMYGVIGQGMHDAIEAVHGTDYSSIGPIYTTIYPVHGGSNDYTYGVLGIWSFTIEIGSTYAPAAVNIRPISEELFPALLHLTEWTYDCNANGLVDSVEIADGDAQDCDANGLPDECEAATTDDFDGDGSSDRCDADIDDDMVPNDIDICDFTVPGSTVGFNGSYAGDRDDDCDSDLLDFVRFPDCIVYFDTATDDLRNWCIGEYDLNTDWYIDLRDFSLIQRGFSGAR